MKLYSSMTHVITHTFSAPDILINHDLMCQDPNLVTDVPLTLSCDIINDQSEEIRILNALYGRTDGNDASFNSIFY